MAIDPLLLPLQDSDSTTRDAALADVVAQHIQPQVQAILTARAYASGDVLDRQELEDLCQDAIGSTLHRLTHGEPVADVRSYVAVVTYNAWNAYLRRKHPRRWRMENRVRYLLRHTPGLREWTSERNEWLASTVPAAAGVADLAEAGAVLERCGPLPFAPLLIATLQKLKRAARGRDLVRLLLERFDTAPAETGTSATQQPPADEQLAWRDSLQSVWRELTQLPLAQRQALLLGLRGEGGEALLKLLPVTGVASIRHIAETLAMDARELAELWPALPLDDLSIAQRLQLKRQQVINLRKSARERLRRRLPEIGGDL